MTEQIDTVQNNVTDVFTFVAGTTRKLLLASLGVAGVAQDEVSGFLHEDDVFLTRLVDRGGKMIEDSRAKAGELFEKRSTQASEVVDKGVKTIDEVNDELLHRLGFPTIADVQDLDKKITALGRKIDRTSRALEQAKDESELPVAS